ncbi:hypothetical protein ENKO_543 [Klebsiella phage fENko-Kae01]|nr:hypothetical protein [Klebsiella phage fENko-Kae01]WNV47640.1 hypothetical protein [Klebsiella phage fENko-Kae01]
MNTVQVLDEIEKIVDSTNKRDILLSRNKANQYEKNCVQSALGGNFESLHSTILQGNNNRPPA